MSCLVPFRLWCWVFCAGVIGKSCKSSMLTETDDVGTGGSSSLSRLLQWREEVEISRGILPTTARTKGTPPRTESYNCPDGGLEVQETGPQNSRRQGCISLRRTTYRFAEASGDCHSNAGMTRRSYSTRMAVQRLSVSFFYKPFLHQQRIPIISLQ